MRTTNTKWKHWNTTPLRLWQTQLNFAVFCTSRTCGVSSEDWNYKKHFMVRLTYRFHVHYHDRGVLKRLQVPLPYELRFNADDNPNSSEGFFKLYHENGVSHEPMSYQNMKFFGTHQHGGWFVS